MEKITTLETVILTYPKKEMPSNELVVQVNAQFKRMGFNCEFRIDDDDDELTFIFEKRELI